MKKLITVCALASLLALPALTRADQIVLDSEKLFSFARHFIERQEYDRAVQELERLVYFFPEDATVPEARYLIGWSYFMDERFERARKALWEVHEDYRRQELGARALFLVGESYRVQGIPDEAAYYYRRVLSEYPGTEVAHNSQLRLGWTQMEAGNWEAASDVFKGVPESSEHHDEALALSQLSLQGAEIPTKSPATAGIMAGVLPGLGHAYCNRYKDAAISLIINGLFTWAAFEAFDRDNEALGTLLGVMELGWYSGNVYSAINCAHKHNLKAREEFIRGLPSRLGFYSNGEDMGLALHFEF